MKDDLARTEYVAQWLKKAQNDLTIAEDERYLKRENFITDGICFHCQQAVEKALKAFLVLHSIEFGKTHNLEILSATCAQVDPDFSNLFFGRLTDYGVSVRYPDDFYMPTLDETDTALQTARETLVFITSRIT